MRKIDLNIDNLISEYNAGKSVKALAKQFGVARSVIVNRLNSAGIQQRNRSDAMYLRMSQTSLEERQRLASAANSAKRGKPNTPDMLHKRALAGKRFIGLFEQEFIDVLTAAGIAVIPQEPFMSYNLDIGCGNIAVEIHHTASSPLAVHHFPKLMNCVKAGKNMLYVWISPRNNIVTDACYENVVSLVKAVSTNPPAKSKYWVIRGTGELYASGSFDSE